MDDAGSHVPVLRDEAVAALAVRCDGAYLDGTFGRGGHAREVLGRLGGDGRLLVMDKDPEAIAVALALAAADPRVRVRHASFATMGAWDEAQAGLDGVLLDLGVSSPQIDQPGRGFSFQSDGPLDMRMDGRGPSAADIVNTADEETLADIFYYYGEERAARRISRAIVHDRLTTPFTSTKALAGLIARVAPARPTDIHPATKSFQALRIAVNDELGELVAALAAVERLLCTGGRLAVVSFHSLEDRIVKQFLAERSGRGETGSRRLPGEPAIDAPTFVCAGRQPVAPAQAECDANPRARSAKLRYAVRTAAPARPPSAKLERLARLPERIGRKP